jgi:hypothetical protein
MLSSAAHESAVVSSIFQSYHNKNSDDIINLVDIELGKALIN